LAAAASVSRATAYRYFPTREELLAAPHPEIEAVSLLGTDPPLDAEARSLLRAALADAASAG
jgi:hypothetical protein